MTWSVISAQQANILKMCQTSAWASPSCNPFSNTQVEGNKTKFCCSIWFLCLSWNLLVSLNGLLKRDKNHHNPKKEFLMENLLVPLDSWHPRIARYNTYLVESRTECCIFWSFSKLGFFLLVCSTIFAQYANILRKV